MPPTRCIRAISSAVTDNTQGAWILPRKAEHLIHGRRLWESFTIFGSKLKRYRKECVSAWRLFGPKLAMEGYLAHTVGIGVDRYYTDLSQATWSTLMEDLPYSMSIPAVDEQQCANAPIWVMWWQGVDNQAPDIIQACVRSIANMPMGIRFTLFRSRIYMSTHPSMRVLCRLRNVVRFRWRCSRTSSVARCCTSMAARGSMPPFT